MLNTHTFNYAWNLASTLEQYPEFIVEEGVKQAISKRKRKINSKFSSRGFVSRLKSERVPLADLLQKGSDNRGGYHVISPFGTSELTVVDKSGQPIYGGSHESIHGIYNPQTGWIGYLAGESNPSVAKKPLIAFKDKGQIHIYSVDGKNYIDENGNEIPLFGGPFDEVQAFDITIPIMEHPIMGNPFSGQIIEKNIEVDLQRLVLARKDDNWMLKHVTGTTFVEGPREVLENVVNGINLGDAIHYFYIGTDSKQQKQ